MDPTECSAVVKYRIKPRARDWSTMADMENEFLSAASKGMHIILIMRSTPTWAQQISGSYCGPIRSDALVAFGNFMHDLVGRYGVPPYNIKYWEIWNEPDAKFQTGDNVYGCWGDENDPYYGGQYYAQVLQAVYPQIKAANPNAQVLIGGLLLDCNPNIQGACSNNKPPKFLEGILLNNGGPYFDGVSFHAYDYYGSALGQYSNSAWNSSWSTTGPAMIAKANYLKNLLANYGVAGKFLMNTEAGFLSDANCDGTFENTKAYYLAQVYASAIVQGLRANVWYSVFGWRCSGLLNPDFSPRPAYSALQFARSELPHAAFLKEITDHPGVNGYRSNRGDNQFGSCGRWMGTTILSRFQYTGCCLGCPRQLGNTSSIDAG
jgi:hypothetical protein